MRIFLAACEDKWIGKFFLKEGLIPNVFLSYYYIRRPNGIENLQWAREKAQKIVIDSGAHTFFAEQETGHLAVSHHKKKTKMKETPQEYFENYKKWVVENHHLFDYFVELDIGELVGQNIVNAWREEWKRLGVYHKCITVYHPRVMTKEDFTAMLKDSQSKYVALEGDRPELRTRLPYMNLIQECYQNGVRVHGFAMTKTDAIMKYPFFSVDSSSWKAGVQYGVTKVKTQKGLKNVVFKNKKHAMSVRNPLIINVLSGNSQERYISALKLGVEAYIQMQDEATKLWNSRKIIWKDI